MDRNETKRLLMAIETIYSSPKGQDLQTKLDIWHSVLKNTSFEKAMEKFTVYAADGGNDYGPKPSYFLSTSSKDGPDIPSYEETRFRSYLNENYEEVRNPDTHQIIDYKKKVKKTQEDKDLLIKFLKVHKYLTFKRFGWEIEQNTIDDYEEMKRIEPEYVEKITFEFNNPKPLPEEKPVDYNQMKADMQRGKQRYDELMKEFMENFKPLY